tara:strand:+ start:651 stop:833 length:183 start_codon:yes stop_codon:yes gene_type:complete
MTRITVTLSPGFTRVLSVLFGTSLILHAMTLAITGFKGKMRRMWAVLKARIFTVLYPIGF